MSLFLEAEADVTEESVPYAVFCLTEEYGENYHECIVIRKSYRVKTSLVSRLFFDSL